MGRSPSHHLKPFVSTSTATTGQRERSGGVGGVQFEVGGEISKREAPWLTLDPPKPKPKSSPATSPEGVSNHCPITIALGRCFRVHPPDRREDCCHHNSTPSPIREEPRIERHEGHNYQPPCPNREVDHGSPFVTLDPQFLVIVPPL